MQCFLMIGAWLLVNAFSFSVEAAFNAISIGSGTKHNADILSLARKPLPLRNHTRGNSARNVVSPGSRVSKLIPKPGQLRTPPLNKKADKIQPNATDGRSTGSTGASRTPHHHNDPMPGNIHVMELQMVRREQDAFNRVIDIAKSHGYSIHGFYHTSAWQTYWKNVISEQLLLLDGKRKVPSDVDSQRPVYNWDNTRLWTSLLNVSDGLYMNVAGPQKSDLTKITELVDSLQLTHREKITLNFNHSLDRLMWNGANETARAWLLTQTNLSSGEFPTIDRLQDYCVDQVKAGKKAFVYYIHNKGGCCYRHRPTDRSPVAAWREAMNAMTIEFPSICTRALLKGYSTCGAENQDGHYSGNFWWADCHHIAQLNRQENRFDPWSAEWFVLKVNPHNGGVNKRFGYQCGYSVHNCGLNLYDHECHRGFYREKLYKYVSGKLGPNMVATNVTDTAICKEVKNKGPYSTQSEVLDKRLRQEHEGLHGGPAHRRNRNRRKLVLDNVVMDSSTAETAEEAVSAVGVGGFDEDKCWFWEEQEQGSKQ